MTGPDGKKIISSDPDMAPIVSHLFGWYATGKCPEPYVREEVISEKFSEILGRLTFGDEVLSWVTKALRDSHADEQKEHETAIARLQAEHDRLQHRLHAMYIDKLDGRIDPSFYTQMSQQRQSEQDKLMQEIIRHQAADRSYLDEGVRLNWVGPRCPAPIRQAGAA